MNNLINKDNHNSWQDIKTAPKDGTAVLAWRDGWYFPQWVHWILNPRTKTTFWNHIGEWDAYDFEIKPPTYWFRLPDYPMKDIAKT